MVLRKYFIRLHDVIFECDLIVFMFSFCTCILYVKLEIKAYQACIISQNFGMFRWELLPILSLKFSGYNIFLEWMKIKNCTNMIYFKNILIRRAKRFKEVLLRFKLRKSFLQIVLSSLLNKTISISFI